MIKLFNEKLSNLHRELYCEATDKMHKEVLKGTRWLLLKNPDNLNPARKESERLQEGLRLNQPPVPGLLRLSHLYRPFGGN